MHVMRSLRSSCCHLFNSENILRHDIAHVVQWHFLFQYVQDKKSTKMLLKGGPHLSSFFLSIKWRDHKIYAP